MSNLNALKSLLAKFIFIIKTNMNINILNISTYSVAVPLSMMYCLTWSMAFCPYVLCSVDNWERIIHLSSCEKNKVENLSIGVKQTHQFTI